jgi:hypothetical protein
VVACVACHTAPVACHTAPAACHTAPVACHTAPVAVCPQWISIHDSMPIVDAPLRTAHAPYTPALVMLLTLRTAATSYPISPFAPGKAPATQHNMPAPALVPPVLPVFSTPRISDSRARTYHLYHAWAPNCVLLCDRPPVFTT